jgi:hypothetical protein
LTIARPGFIWAHVQAPLPAAWSVKSNWLVIFPVGVIEAPWYVIAEIELWERSIHSCWVEVNPERGEKTSDDQLVCWRVKPKHWWQEDPHGRDEQLTEYAWVTQGNADKIKNRKSQILCIK